MLYKQLVTPRQGTADGLGWCLRFTQSAFGAPVLYPSATAAWWAQLGRREGAPPAGVAVPIWFEHFGSYGTPRSWGNWGHVAVRLADGRVLTSPFFASQLTGRSVGQAIYPSIQAMCDAIPGGAKYLGWSEYMNGLRVVEPVTTMPSGQEEDEDMATRPLGHYIGGSEATPAKERKWVIYYPDSGLYMFVGGVSQEYINTQAQAHGTKPFTHITEAHWADQLRPHLDKILAG